MRLSISYTTRAPRPGEKDGVDYHFVDEPKFKQLTLDFDDEEKRQLESNIRSWHTRLEQFDRELEREPKRIREFYEVRARRVEPVGLVYLHAEGPGGGVGREFSFPGDRPSIRARSAVGALHLVRRLLMES